MVLDRSTLLLAGALGAIAALGVAGSVDRVSSSAGQSADAVVPEFSLLDASERPITRRELLGHVWVADFIYLQCTDTCPLLNRRIVDLLQQTAAPAVAERVRFVSFSVGREDGPKALRRFVRGFPGVDTSRWHVLAAERTSLGRIASAFGLGAGASPDGDLPFSANLFLVDRHGVVRRGYDGTNAAEMTRLRDDLLALAKAAL